MIYDVSIAILSRGSGEVHQKSAGTQRVKEEAYMVFLAIDIYINNSC